MLFNLFLSAISYVLLQSHFVTATKSKGCGNEVASSLKRGGFGKSNDVPFITSSGSKRTFLLHIPTSYDVNKATPLIFSFHGRSESGTGQESKSRLSDETLNPDKFVVYPNGIDQQWQGDPAATSDDVSFVLDLIGSLEDEFCIDTDRIYSSGHSNGGGFSLNILACDATASKKIAAFMGSAAATYQGTTDANCHGATVPIKCNPGRKLIPILETHGSADDTIAYNGGPRRQRCIPSAPHFVTEWAKRNGLGGDNTTTIRTSLVKEYQFGWKEGVPGLVTHYRVQGMGHAWPWESQGGGFDATPVVLDFFNSHKLGSSVAKTSSETSHAATSIASPPSVAKPTCPASDGKTFTTERGFKYAVHCASDSTGKLVTGVTNPGSFALCMAYCDGTAGCKSVSYDGACYMKGNAGKLIQKSTQGNRVAIRVS